ncbi:hypothetical protein SMICM304S_02957 [Streptomyces microflavus]
MLRQPSKSVRPVARCQRPAASASEILTTQPITAAHIRVYPNLEPAISVATRSPAPTPVAATTMPGPMYFQLDLRGREAGSPASVVALVSAMPIKEAQSAGRHKGACADSVGGGGAMG